MQMKTTNCQIVFAGGKVVLTNAKSWSVKNVYCIWKCYFPSICSEFSILH